MGRPALQAVADIGAPYGEAARKRTFPQWGGRRKVSGAILPMRTSICFSAIAKSKINRSLWFSIVAHTVALNDGTYWRDFDEKTSKGSSGCIPRGVSTPFRNPPQSYWVRQRIARPSHFCCRRIFLMWIAGELCVPCRDHLILPYRYDNARTSWPRCKCIDTHVCLRIVRSAAAAAEACVDLGGLPPSLFFHPKVFTDLSWRRIPWIANGGHRLVWATRGRGFEAPGARERRPNPSSKQLAQANA